MRCVRPLGGAWAARTPGAADHLPIRAGRVTRLAVFPALVAALLWAGGVVLARPAERAAGPLPAAPKVSITMVSGSALRLDSNSPCAAGPRAAYVAFRVTNTTGATQKDLWATIGGFSGGIELGGGQGASQYIGSLAGGASRTLYWFVAYPCTFGVTSNLTVSVTDGSATPATGSGTVYTASAISAAAGGQMLSTTLGPGAVVGQLIELDVEYTFGGANPGDTYDMQPAGNPGFAAGCFQVVRTRVVASMVAAIPVGTEDRLFFVTSTREPGTDYRVTMRYYFKYVCAGVNSTANPYATQTSGSENVKYMGNFSGTSSGGGGGGGSFPAGSISFTVSKSVSPATLNQADTVTYRVDIRNTSTFVSAIDSIVDVLPAGLVYLGMTAASEVTEDSSSLVPAVPSTGTLRWRGPYNVAVGDTLTLVYRAAVPRTAGEYTNSLTAYSGTTAVGTGAAKVTVRSADVSATVTGPATAVVGDTLRYVVSHSNAGPAAAVRVARTDTLPAGMSLLSATGSATLSGRVLSWPVVSSLASGATLTDTVTLVATAAGSQTSVAASTSGTDDPAPANNDGSSAAGRATTVVAERLYRVDVTPRGLVDAAGDTVPVRRLPGGPYAQLYTVVNQSNVRESFDLLAGASGTPGSFMAVDSLTGPGIGTRVRPDSARVYLLVGESRQYTVWYTVPPGDTATNVLSLRARSVSQDTVRSTGWVDVRRGYPVVALTRAVDPSATSAPGTDLTYTLWVRNAGDYEARDVSVTDLIPPALMLKVGSVEQSVPAGLSVTISYSADGGASWSHSPGSGMCGAPPGYDGCVQAIRWTLQGDLSPDTQPSGTLRFVARIR